MPRTVPRYNYDFWNYLSQRHLLAPYTWICAWDIGTNSLSHTNNWTIIDIAIPFGMFLTIPGPRRGLITGYLTEDDMWLAIKLINHNHLLIAYSVPDALSVFKVQQKELKHDYTTLY